MQRRLAALLLSTAAVVACLGTSPGPADVAGDHTVTPAGRKLAALLDATDVEHLWLPDHYVAWRTGAATTRPLRGGVKSSHCSAYAAAVADRLGVYLLRPPEHGSALLANAQAQWLAEGGRDQGWTPVDTAERAQADANAGRLVVAVYRAADATRPGHIAVVRPAVRTAQDLEDKGPEISQAGATNHADTTVSTGFSHHPGAWDETGHGVKFYAHDVVPHPGGTGSTRWSGDERSRGPGGFRAGGRTTR